MSLHHHFFLPLVLTLLSGSIAFSQSNTSPATLPAVRNKDTPRDFPPIKDQQEWGERAAEIREQILVSAGLWPLPEKTPLHQSISGRIERDGYSVEKVYFQTYPGFYLAGNLYRPLGKGSGPFPAILNPHGHWEKGRLADDKDVSVSGRCINFARQGMIAFSYDMVGYNDTHFPESPTNTSFWEVHRNFAINDPVNLLWNISLMGLQTWNSVRALDFLESLPDVNALRIGCTGASGGGTQTFILGAVDDSLAAQAPVVMVSHIMQGGCACENMPGLRVEFSNMEIAAAAAPRPQILVGAAGDWTKTTLEVEGPAIARIYELLHAPENIRYVRFNFDHNYNQSSRQAVYQWFDKFLLPRPDAPVRELAFQKEPDKDLRVFPDGKLPPDAISEAELIQNIKKNHQAKLDEITPKDKSSWDNYVRIIEPAWKRTLLLDGPRAPLQKQIMPAVADHDFQAERVEIKRQGESESINLTHFVPSKAGDSSSPVLVVLVNEQPASYIHESGAPLGLARQLLDRHYDVAVVTDLPAADPKQRSVFFTVYNRTQLQKQVRDLAAICAELKEMHSKSFRVVLCGSGRAGLWCLLAAPAADGVVADCAELDVSDNKNLLAADLYCPGIRNIHTFIGAPILAAPHPLLLHNFDSHFPLVPLEQTYKALKQPNRLRTESKPLADSAIINWLSQLE